jgi:ATP-dependent Zn protease
MKLITILVFLTMIWIRQRLSGMNVEEFDKLCSIYTTKTVEINNIKTLVNSNYTTGEIYDMYEDDSVINIHIPKIVSIFKNNHNVVEYCIKDDTNMFISWLHLSLVLNFTFLYLCFLWNISETFTNWIENKARTM